MQKDSDYQPSYTILYSGDATDWKLAVNDNKSANTQNYMKKVLWLGILAALGVVIYFVSH